MTYKLQLEVILEGLEALKALNLIHIEDSLLQGSTKFWLRIHYQVILPHAANSNNKLFLCHVVHWEELKTPQTLKINAMKITTRKKLESKKKVSNSIPLELIRRTTSHLIDLESRKSHPDSHTFDWELDPPITG